MKLTLTHSELTSLYRYLLAIMHRSNELSQQSKYLELQLEILGDFLEKKVHPKVLVEKAKPTSLKLKKYQYLALQLSFAEGWTQFVDDFYTQNVIRNIAMHKLPAFAVVHKDQLALPDQWE